MSTAKVAVEALLSATRAFLDQLGLKYTPRDDGWVRLLFGSPGDVVTVWLLPQEWLGGDTLLQIIAVVREDVTTGEHLDVFLLDENSKLLFGKLVVDERGSVRFTHPLLGNFLNRAELEAAIALASSMARTYGPVVGARFGGRSPA